MADANDALNFNYFDDTDYVNKWSNLLPDLLHLIVFEFDNHKDLLTFRSVCNSWRSVAMGDARLTPFSPLFFIPYTSPSCLYPFDDDDDDEAPFHDPYSLTFVDPSSCNELTVQLPESVYKYVRATAYGYLILVSSIGDGNGFSDVLVSLFNPITRSQIQLPVLHSLVRIRDWHSDFRALLSSHPRFEPPPVLAIWSGRELFFLTLGDDHWTSFELGDREKDYDYTCWEAWEDRGVLAYCQNSFFLSSTRNRKLKVIDAQSLESSELDVPLEENMRETSYHMIHFSGDLFLVVSNYFTPHPDNYMPYATFKLVKEHGGQWRWSKEDYSNNECVTSGCAFFLSKNLSVAVASPGLIACRANCIYNAFGYEVTRDWPDVIECVVCTAEFNLPFSMDWDSANRNNVEDCFWISPEYNHCSVSSEYTWFLPSIS